MQEPEMEIIGKMYSRVLSNPDDSELRAKVSMEVRELCQGFPIYEDLDLWQ
jgi:glycine/serine hydroxymethyltransferase